MSALPFDRTGRIDRPPHDLPVALAWALGASLLLHALFVAVTYGGADFGDAARREPQALRAVLTVPDVTASLETSLAPTPIALSTPTREPLASLTLPPLPVVVPEPPQAAASRGATGDGPGLGQAVGAVLRDRNRLGDLYTRGQNDFPIEVDMPVRLDSRIVARYPAAALAAGREDSVVAWVVVNEQGRASEIEIPEGTEEFAEQVRAALRSAHFRPAEDKLKPIRFPMALQFDFRTGATTGANAEAR